MDVLHLAVYSLFRERISLALVGIRVCPLALIILRGFLNSQLVKAPSCALHPTVHAVIRRSPFTPGYAVH